MKFKTFITTLLLFQIFFYGGFLFISADMTDNRVREAKERVAGEYALIRHTIAAETAETKQRYADNFSHELRTPLTSIYGSAEYLQKTNTTEEEKFELTERIITECRHLLKMDEHMLELAALRKPEVQLEDVPVTELFESVKESLQVKLRKKHINLTWQSEIDFFNGDRTLLKSLLINLTDNAADACGEDGNITWRAERSANGSVMKKSLTPLLTILAIAGCAAVFAFANEAILKNAAEKSIESAYTVTEVSGGYVLEGEAGGIGISWKEVNIPAKNALPSGEAGRGKIKEEPK